MTGNHVFITSLTVLVSVAGATCQREGNQTSSHQIQLTINPSEPDVGEATMELTLREQGGTPVPGAEVKLEGNMNHAGMKPVFSMLSDAGSGVYRGTLDFTMCGDWFILVSAKLPEGSTVQDKINVSVCPR